MPKKAGNLSFKKFMIAFNMPATAPGFVTRSFRFGTLTFNPALDAPLAAMLAYLELRPCFSAAAASISGPIDLVIFDGNCSTSFWSQGGRWVYVRWI